MKLEEINKLIKDFEKSNLRELELKIGDTHIKLSKNENTFITKENQYNNIENKNEQHEDKNVPITSSNLEPVVNMPEHFVKSPLVGTFYEASDPKNKPFVKVGDHVKKGQILCIIEAMKIMNEISSPFDGVISSINYNNGDVVGFDDCIMVIKDEHSTK